MRNIAVWFSCGAASAVAAKKTIELFPNDNIRVLNTPVPEEDIDNQRFRVDVESWLGVKIETVVNKNKNYRSCDDVWKSNYMSTPSGAKCTQLIKKQSRQQWEKKNRGYEHVLGFTYDEKKRHEKFIISERDLIPALIDLKISKSQCYEILIDEGIELPRVYRMGFPNANCIGCPKATSPTYWNLVREKFPDVFSKRVRQSERYGAKLVRYKGERIPLSDLPIDARGRPLKNMDFECGIFCEEKNI